MMAHENPLEEREYPISCCTELNRALIPLIRSKLAQSWLPVSIYQKHFWLVQISGEHEWPAGYWIRQTDKNFVCAQFILEGDMTVECERQVMIVKAGDGVIIPAGDSILATGPSGYVKKLYFIPVGEIFERSISGLMYDHLHLLPQILTPDFLAFYMKVKNLYDSRNSQKILEIAGLIYQLVLTTTGYIENGEYPALMVRILDYIRVNLSHPMTLDDICRAQNIGRTRLKELFHQYLHMTPGNYLLKVKMETACKLLDMKCYLIKEVALNCGFRSQLYFSNVFRRYYGLSPREYLQNCRNKEI